MDSIHDAIIKFGCGEWPHENELVVWDGLDQLEKEGAVQFFSGKTWREVLSHLQELKNDQVYGAAYFLEEWTVLSSQSLGYYARAYLEYLRETLDSAQPDEEFVFFFLGALNQVANMASQFSSIQIEFLRRIIQYTMQEVSTSVSFEYFADDIRDQAIKFLKVTSINHS